ncbi:MAG: hypothetical protein KatS3mg102_1075 [Planctomycetota bacterium]|nr:MAG: hypothetical protein KatS3mg102_1075 [Planctomycetota bacterium]
MNVSALRGLVLVVNLLLLGAIGHAAWRTFGPVDWSVWGLSPPELEQFDPPLLGEDPQRRERALYQTIAEVFERPQPRSAPAAAEPAPAAAPPPPSVRDLQVRLLAYDRGQPERSSALLYDPRSQLERFFQVGLDLGQPGLGFERYKGTRVQAITPEAVVLLTEQGEKVELPAPGPATRKP